MCRYERFFLSQKYCDRYALLPLRGLFPAPSPPTCRQDPTSYFYFLRQLFIHFSERTASIQPSEDWWRIQQVHRGFDWVSLLHLQD